MRIVLFVFLLFSLSSAHKLNLFLVQEDNRVYASAYFASGAYCKGCLIKVSNSKEKLLQEGNTSDKGEFTITKLDSSINVKVEVEGGHSAQKSINVKLTNKKVLKKEYEVLIKENQRLKSKIALLEEQNSLGQIFKMIFALIVIAGIFFALKRVKK